MFRSRACTWIESASRSDEMQCAGSARRRTFDPRFLSRLLRPIPLSRCWLNPFHIIIDDHGSCAPRVPASSTTTMTRSIAMTALRLLLRRYGVRPPCDVLLCKFNDVVDAMLVLSHGHAVPVGGEFVPRYLKVFTGEHLINRATFGNVRVINTAPAWW